MMSKTVLQKPKAWCYIRKLCKVLGDISEKSLELRLGIWMHESRWAILHQPVDIWGLHLHKKRREAQQNLARDTGYW